MFQSLTAMSHVAAPFPHTSSASEILNVFFFLIFNQLMSPLPSNTRTSLVGAAGWLMLHHPPGGWPGTCWRLQISRQLRCHTSPNSYQAGDACTTRKQKQCRETQSVLLPPGSVTQSWKQSRFSAAAFAGVSTPGF